MAQKAPIFLHAEHGISGTTEIFDVIFQQYIVKTFQGLLISATQKTRIADKTTADHHGLHLGEFLPESLRFT